MELTRDLIKYVRDRAKSGYVLADECEICNSNVRLELHHYYSISPLVEKWMFSKKYKPEDVILWRDEFITEHRRELYGESVTLCHYHHIDVLHRIYGQCPNLATAPKQKNWVKIQREKYGKLAR